MSTLTELAGIVPILPTPLTDEGELDEPGLVELVEFCVGQDFATVTVLGSNGEFPYLSFDERLRVMRAASDAAAGRLPVIGTASAPGTREAITLACEAREAGCAAVMAALLPYFAVEPAAVVEHYRALATNGGLPVVLYHFPEVTGLELSIETITELAAIEGVDAAKLTVLNVSWLEAAIAAGTPSGLRVFAGSSFLLADCLAAGGSGVFCPLPLLAPGDVGAVLAAAEAGDDARARALQDDLRRALPLMSGLDVDVDLLVAGLEAAVHAGYEGAGSRPPATHGLRG